MTSNKQLLLSVNIPLIVVCLIVITTKAQWIIDDHGCRTPGGGTGSCIAIENCSPIMEFIQNHSLVSQYANNALVSYYCGVTKNSVKVCCSHDPIIIPTRMLEEPVISVREQPLNQCRTPDASTGLCIPIKECKALTDFIEKSQPLTQHSIETIQSYQCGDAENGVQVCCPENPIASITANPEIHSETEKLPENGCRTPDESVGSCIPIKECQTILNFIETSQPLSQQAITTIQSYQCGVTENAVQVCCPKAPITAETGSTVISTTTEKPPEDECRTPDQNVGSCILIKDCQPIIKFIEKSIPLSQSAIQTLQGYQCGFINNSVKVCCPNNSTVLETAQVETSTTVEKPADVSNHKNFNFLPYECGIQMGSSRIFGGYKTVLFEYPWMALLAYEKGTVREFRCGGTIISEWYILTAAHCITNISPQKLVGVRLGEYNISSVMDCEKEPFGDEYCAPPVQDLAIAEVIPHPKYNTTSFINDIGLIRLASPIDVTVDNAKPICLPTTEDVRDKNFVNTNLTVTGWGYTETGRRSADLLKADLLVSAVDHCRETYKKSPVTISHKQICAGGQNGADSCTGDSGGPLQTNLLYKDNVRFIQFGVVSFGPRFCGRKGFPGAYTRVDYYLDWILDNIKP